MPVTDTQLFQSANPIYKRPYGAVPAGTLVEFTLRPGRDEGFSRAVLHARFEFRDNAVADIPLLWRDTRLGRDTFSGALDTGDYTGLIWYCFTLEGLDGRRRQTGEYQLTVYDPEHPAPDWFGRGVTYQIFPDRFRRTRMPDPQGLPGNRVVHADWCAEPEFRPDAQGQIRNRDFFGGDLPGITEKLDYLQGLGVETLYLCPIFEAAENHRYGTADYHKIDPMLGTREDFEALCRAAHDRGIRVLLDGVFNHTGFVSRYFNGDGFYPDMGAAQSPDSPYFSWFRFTHWPHEYESWWGVRTLPAVEEGEPSYRRFLYGDGDSVIRRWLRAGADGWRLDVADELPDDFIAGLRAAAREEKSHAVLIGEVWEDGSNKIAYGQRRRHLLGGHCDGLMNYPLRTALLRFFLDGDGGGFVREMETLRENYPRKAFFSAMNALGTHDTPRILTLLGQDGTPASREERAAARLGPEQRRRGLERLMAAALLLYAFPGSPTVYYGDEAGMEGYEDPFNRRTFPWGGEDAELQDYFRALGAVRKTSPALRGGSLRFVAGERNLLAFLRRGQGETLLAAFNAGDSSRHLLWRGPPPQDCLLGPGRARNGRGGVLLTLPPRSGCLWRL